MTETELARAQAFIEAIDHLFRTARDDLGHPHAYITRKWLTPELMVEYDWLRDLVGRVGYRETFLGSRWAYIDLPPWKLWFSRSWYDAEGDGVGQMLNRRNLDSGQLRLELGGAA